MIEKLFIIKLICTFYDLLASFFILCLVNIFFERFLLFAHSRKKKNLNVEPFSKQILETFISNERIL